MSGAMASTDRARSIMNQLVRSFSTSAFPEVAAKAYITVPDIPSAKWSLRNRIIMHINGTADARGFAQWKSVGRSVKKGSKAFYILGPKLARRTTDDGETEKRIIGFVCIPMFRYEDTEGDDLPKFRPRRLPPLFKLAEHNGIDVRYGRTMDGEYGSIDLEGKSIRLSTESADTFLHEMMHFYDLRDRPDRKPGQDKTQEIVAQFGACVLAKMYGYDSAAFTWKYISAYSNTDKPSEVARECITVLERTDRAITDMLKDAEKLDSVESQGTDAA